MTALALLGSQMRGPGGRGSVVHETRPVADLKPRATDLERVGTNIPKSPASAPIRAPARN